MQKLNVMLVVIALAIMAEAKTWTDSDTGITWDYHLRDDGFAVIGTGESFDSAIDRSITGTVNIPAQVNGVEVREVAPYGMYNVSAERVVLPSGIEVIGKSAFMQCYKLTGITLNEGLREIGDYAFMYCDKLTSIAIPSSVLSIGSDCFYWDDALSTVTGGSGLTNVAATAFSLTPWLTNKSKTEPVYIGKVFYKLDSSSTISTLVIPNGIVSISPSACYRCENLKTVTFPTSLKSIGKGAFYLCSGITHANISSVNAWSQVNIDDYATCRYVTEHLYINGSPLTDLVLLDELTEVKQWTFSYCRSLRTLALPSKIKRIGWYAFGGCTNLASVSFPVGLESISSNAFLSCSRLDKVTVPATVQEIGESAFFGCTGLSEMTLPFVGAHRGADSDSRKNAFGHIFGTRLDGKIPSGLKSLTIIDDTDISSSAFNGCESLDSVAIQRACSVGDYAFYRCSALQSISLPDGLQRIGAQAFSACCSLKTLTIPSSVTEIGGGFVGNCGDLTSVDLTGNSVYEMKSNCLVRKSDQALIAYCASSKPVFDIPSGITSIGSQAFVGCGSLSILTIPNTVTNIGDWAFSGYMPIYNLTIPDSVVSIGRGAFYGMVPISAITVGSGVRDVGENAFSNCLELKKVNIKSVDDWAQIKFANSSANPLCNTGCQLYCNDELVTEAILSNAVGSIGSYVFYGCNELTKVYIPASVLSIGQGAFEGCGISSVRVEDSDGFYAALCKGAGKYPFSVAITEEGQSVSHVSVPDDVKTLGTVFQGNTNLEAIVIGSGVVSIDNSAFQGCKNLKSVTLSEGLEKIGWCAFCDCSALSSITIPSTVSAIGTCAFSGCTSLGSGVVIRNGCVLTVNGTCPDNVNLPVGTRIIAGGAFYSNYGNTDLESITIPNGVTYIGDDAFRNCYKIAKVSIPKGVTYLGASAFEDCYGLSEISLPESLMAIESRLFYECSKLSVLNIPSHVASIGSYAFYNCKRLASATIPKSVSSIGDSAFYSCTNLTSVSIANGVRSIGNSAFSHCEALPSIEIPNSVTNIGSSVGANCYALRSIDLGSGLTRVPYYAFYDCRSIETVTLGKNIVYVENYAFYERYKSKFTVVQRGKQNIYWASYAYWYTPTFVYQPILFSVIYNPNGGCCDTLRQETEEDATIEALPTPTYDGHVFEGWFTSAVDGERIDEGFIPENNLTLYAYWTPISYTVRYDGNGGDGEMEDQSFVYDEAKVLTACGFAREGYDFVGWAAREVTSSTDWVDGAVVSNLTAEADGVVTLYAVWSQHVWTIAEALDAEGLTFTPGGDQPWFIDTAVGHGGIASMRSGAIGNKQESTLTTTVFGAGELSFWCKVSSEADADDGEVYDGLAVLVDGEDALGGLVGGEVNWTNVTVTVSGVGSHTICWSYEKDKRDSDGDDCAWLDQIVWTPTSPIPDLGDEPTVEEITNVLNKAEDSKLAEKITNETDYVAFREWSGKVKQEKGGATTVGAAGVMAAPHAWVSYALGSETLLETAPTDADLKVEAFEPKSGEDGKFDFTVSVEGVEVGGATETEAQKEQLKENLKQVFGLEGGTTLEASGMSSENVDIAFETPQDGKVKFTAGPKDAGAKTFFMRVKVNQ